MRYILFALLVSLSSQVFSVCSGVSCQDVTVDRLIVNLNSSVISIGTSGNELNLDCTPNNDQYITLAMDQISSKEVYAAALAAHQSKNRFWIRTTGAGEVCQVVYIVSDN